uniref:Uncharacterized protein n=1 Tax=Anguilla anguilla TaxID=7936 RepID=A0A0E9PTW9_ANGAN
MAIHEEHVSHSNGHVSVENNQFLFASQQCFGASNNRSEEL